MSETAKLILDGKTYEFPVIIGTEGERAIDISTLRQQTASSRMTRDSPTRARARAASPLWTVKKGFSVTGLPVEELAEHSTFVETAYLLINGELPSRKELTRFSVMLNDHSLFTKTCGSFSRTFPEEPILWASCPQW